MSLSESPSSINIWMKGIFLACILGTLTFFASNYTKAAGFWMEVPPQCIVDVRIASTLAKIYDSGATKDETMKQIDIMEQHPNVSRETADLARDITEVLYVVQPKTNKDYEAIYRGVVSKCEQRTIIKQQRRQRV